MARSRLGPPVVRPTPGVVLPRLPFLVLIGLAVTAAVSACDDDPAPVVVQPPPTGTAPVAPPDSGAPATETPSATELMPATEAPSTTLEGNATVVYITDGDTIIVRIAGHDEHVRLVGIDTPETKKPDVPVQCFGPEASARTAELLPKGAAVRLERDVEARDQYNRLLAYVFRVEDGLFVNQQLVAEGFARELWVRPNHAYRPQIDAAAAEARSAGRGLWGACEGTVASPP